MKRTEKEIEKKIEELLDEDNFTDVVIDYIEGDSEVIFDSCEARRTLKDFVKWLKED